MAGEIIELDDLFFASKLVEIIIKNETINIQSSRALVALSNQVALSSYAADLKTFNFDVRSECSDIKFGSLRLRIIKGSVFTYIWNTFARVDDEYILDFMCDGSDVAITKNLWVLKGMDPWNSRIVEGDVNWVNMRGIYHRMGVSSIGVLAFAKLVGRITLSLPNYFKERYFLAPMPAAFMFNYMMSITSCPCENLTNQLSMTASAGLTNRKISILNALILPNGAGQYLKDYQIVRLQSQKLALTLSKSNEAKIAMGSEHFSPEAHIRVVEVRSHPLGLKGLEMLVVLEIVSKNLAKESFRVLCLDPEKIALAMGRNDEAVELIEVIDAEEWDQYSRLWTETISGGNENRRLHCSKLSSIDFLNSSEWGSAQYHIAVYEYAYSQPYGCLPTANY